MAAGVGGFGLCFCWRASSFSCGRPARERVHPQPHLAQGGVSVQLSYVVPTYTFRQEGGFVIDALTYQTNVVNERLPASRARLK